jgi:hypothetical protein
MENTMKLLKGTILTGLLLATVACGDGYSNLSLSGSQSRKSKDSVSKSNDNSRNDSSSDDNSSDDNSSDDNSSDSSPSRGGGDSNESRSDLLRGSNAWFAHESVEHALRLAILSNAELAASVSGTSSVIQGQTSTVEIALASGAKLIYACRMFDSSSRSGTVMKKDVSCTVAR